MAAGFDVEDQRAVADAANFFDVVADFLEHLTDFAIAAFDEDQFVPGIVGVSQEPDAGGGGHDAALIAAGGRRAGLSDLGTAIDHDAVAELVDRRVRGLAADFDEVGFLDAGGGAGEGVGEVAVVGHEEEAFARVVEAADGEYALASFEEVGDGGAMFGVAGGSDVALRLVENVVAGALGAMEELAVDANVVAGGVRFGAEFGDGLAVDLDASGDDELFGLAARGDAGGGDDFLQTLRRRCFGFGIVRDGFIPQGLTPQIEFGRFRHPFDYAPSPPHRAKTGHAATPSHQLRVCRGPRLRRCAQSRLNQVVRWRLGLVCQSGAGHGRRPVLVQRQY